MNQNFIVTKSNYFIGNSSYDLSTEEQRIILTLASMVQPEDEGFKPYDIKISEFLNLLGLKDRSKYSQLPVITKELMKKVFEIKEEKSTIQVAWLSSAEYNHETGVISLEFSPRLKPYLLQLKNYFTQYKLSNILQMKSKYSPRLYEILKMNEFNKKGFEISVDELRRLFKAENLYKNYNDFKKKVILKAQEELNLYTDIKFDFLEIKLGRKVDSIVFFIFKNKNQEVPKKSKKIVKTKKEINTEKFIKNQEKDIEKNQKVHQEFEELYKNFLELPEEKRIEIEKETYEDFLKESNSIDNKTIRGIFEKSKKSLIIKKIKN